MGTTVGIFIAAGLTLCVYSFLYQDNPGFSLDCRPYSWTWHSSIWPSTDPSDTCDLQEHWVTNASHLGFSPGILLGNAPGRRGDVEDAGRPSVRTDLSSSCDDP